MPESLDSNDLLQQLMEHRSRLWALAYSIVRDYHMAGDVIQEVCIKVGKNADKYDPSRPLLGWALTITRNAALEALRKQKRQACPMEDETLTALQDKLVEMPERDESQRFFALKNCLGRVSPENREVLEKMYLDKVSVAEIAQKIKRTEKATNSLLQRLRASMAKCIDGVLREGAAYE